MNYHSGRWTENNKNSLDEHKRDNTQATIPRCYFMFFFYVFKMAVAIAFLCKNAVEAVQFFFYFYDFKLKLLLQHFTEKHSSHGHFQCIKMH